MKTIVLFYIIFIVSSCAVNTSAHDLLKYSISHYKNDDAFQVCGINYEKYISEFYEKGSIRKEIHLRTYDKKFSPENNISIGTTLKEMHKMGYLESDYSKDERQYILLHSGWLAYFNLPQKGPENGLGEYKMINDDDKIIRFEYREII